MACIKCGKDTVGGAEFCEECLAEMIRYPVKPGTPVILHKREESASIKHNRKKSVKPELQVAHLKRIIRWLVGIIAALFLLIAVALMCYFYLLDGSVTSLLP